LAAQQSSACWRRSVFALLQVTYFWFGGHFPATVDFLNVLYILFTEQTMTAQMDFELAAGG
jgi:hypothetical protein